MSIRDKLFSFQGRLRRRDWWLYGVALNLLGVLLSTLAASLLVGMETNADGSARAPLDMISIGVAALLIWPTLALTVKRRHDTAFTGLFAAAAFCVYVILNTLPLLWVILWIKAFELLGFWGGLGAMLAVFGGGLAWLVYILGVRDGDPGPNQFGPSPKVDEAVT